MGKRARPGKVKLIAGLLFNEKCNIKKVYNVLKNKFGAIDLVSPDFIFKVTDYYEQEMGAELKKHIVSFEKLIDPGKIADIKITTNRLERKFSENSKRTVNIDPGYITMAKLVLATTKNFSHRIYIKKGIYAEITLSYRNGKFTPHELTYPDHRTEEYINFFHKIRNVYEKQIMPDKKN